MLWLILLLVVILVAGITTTIILVRRKSKSTHIGGGGNGGGGDVVKCRVSSNSDDLTECDPNDTNSCEKCGGLFSCYAVTDDSPYKYTIYKGNNHTELKVPNGSWCLPTKTKTLPCNQYSGFPILTRVSPTENAWTCNCKYPQLFQTAGLFGNCLDEIACNGEGHLVCPPGHSFCKERRNRIPI